MERERNEALSKLRELCPNPEEKEKDILKFCIVQAKKEKIHLDWNNELFTKLYFSYIKRQCDLLKLGISDFTLNDNDVFKLNLEFSKEREITFAKDISCGKCKMFKIEVSRKIERSLDEGMTVKYYCHNCQNQWKEN